MFNCLFCTLFKAHAIAIRKLSGGMGMSFICHSHRFGGLFKEFSCIWLLFWSALASVYEEFQLNVEARFLIRRLIKCIMDLVALVPCLSMW